MLICMHMWMGHIINKGILKVLYNHEYFLLVLNTIICLLVHMVHRPQNKDKVHFIYFLLKTKKICLSNCQVIGLFDKKRKSHFSYVTNTQLLFINATYLFFAEWQRNSSNWYSWPSFSLHTYIRQSYVRSDNVQLTD